MFILEVDMPESRAISVEVYLMQSRSKMRNAGDKMEELTANSGDTSTAGKIVKTLGKSTPWIAVAATAGQGIGKILSGMKDRQMGFLSMDESFQADASGVFDRTNKFSTGFGELQWSWIVS